MNKDTIISDKYHFSLFKGPCPITTRPGNIPDKEPITLWQIYNVIKGKNLVLITESIRNEPNKVRRSKLKKTLPFVTFAGTFKYRNAKSLIKTSGLIVIDLDDLTDIDTIKAKILLKIKPALLFVSPSGNGLKIVYAMKIDQGTHIQYFFALKEFYTRIIGVNVDQSNSDISRACFLCHDPHPFYTNNPFVLCKTFLDEFMPIGNNSRMKPSKRNSPTAHYNYETTEIELYRRAKVWTDKCVSFKEGSRNNYISKLVGLCHRWGLSENNTFSFVTEFQQPDFTIKEIRAIVRCIFLNSSYAGIAPPNLNRTYNNSVSCTTKKSSD